MNQNVFPPGVDVTVPVSPVFSEILSPAALEFVAGLERGFGATREKLLARRVERQHALDAGVMPDFIPETGAIRSEPWTIGPVPAELLDRRVEITGPVDRKMVINGLNSGAKVFMADLEDSLSPTWQNVIDGQINLRDAVTRSISFVSNVGKIYALDENPAVLFVRPRGWHLVEKHVRVDGKSVSAALFDFGLYFFHNAKHLLSRGSAPYFYLPKMESHLEARLWNDVFVWAQEELGIPRGTVKATVLIETILAAFEMDEILYELREHSAGLNCGRWDYIFSCIKKFHAKRDFVLAERAYLTMTTPFMRAYTLLTIKTCHRRGAHAIGGMAAQIPIKDDVQANASAIAKVRADKDREAADGHDGTWVAHPGLVRTAMEAFELVMPTPNQIHKLREDVEVSADQLLAFGPESPITEEGLLTDIEVAVEYLGAWLSGHGAVPIHNLMEDAATAEISRSQVWQWVRSEKGVLDDGRKVTLDLVREMVPRALERVRRNVGEQRFESSGYGQGAELFDRLVSDDDFAEFLTIPAYAYLS
jgi:malate synthase